MEYYNVKKDILNNICSFTHFYLVFQGVRGPGAGGGRDSKVSREIPNIFCVYVSILVMERDAQSFQKAKPDYLSNGKLGIQIPAE